MKKEYTNPEIQIIAFDAETSIMDGSAKLTTNNSVQTNINKTIDYSQLK